MKGLPRFTYGVLIEDSSTTPPTETYEGNLTSIPERYLRLHPSDRKRVLRQEGETSLAEIKRFHRKVAASQGFTEEQFLDSCKRLIFSVDGVKESSHAKR